MASKTVAQGPVSACALDSNRVFLSRFGADPDKPTLAAILSASEARKLAQELNRAADIATRGKEVSHG